MSLLLSLAPILALVVMLTVFRLAAWKAALGALALGASLALVSGTAAGLVARAAWAGARTGLYPIGLVIVGALFVYGVVVESGRLATIKAGLAALAPDRGFAALLIVWGFGNFMEGMAGFGTAVAIPCAILVGIGFDPVKAVLCCLATNTVSTAFGSVGVPSLLLAGEAGVAVGPLATLTAVLQLGVTLLGPFLILGIVGGAAELRRHWGLALLADLAFVVPCVAVAHFLGPELPDIIGGLAVMALLFFLGRRDGFDAKAQALAWAPFGCVVAFLCAAAFLPTACKPAPGIFLVLAGLVGARIQQVPLKRAVALIAETAFRYRLALLTVCAISALARIMGESGMIRTIAEALVAATGSAFAFCSPVVGALGGFMTGSGTNACLLFGQLQSSVGAERGLSLLYAAANVMGAGIGKMICPQSIVLGCAAAGIAGRENALFLRALRLFIPILILAGLLVAGFARFLSR